MAARAQMVDTFTPYSPNGNTLDADGFQVPAFLAQAATPGKIQSRTGGLGAAGDASTRFVTIGGVERPVLEGGLHLPIDAPLPVAGAQGVGWEYECTAIGADSDPAMLGRRWLVVSVPVKTLATARRIDVAEV